MSVISTDPPCKESLMHSATHLKLCLIKFELDINDYNFETDFLIMDL